ncbi:ABC transporter F family member 4-like [Solea solea]|uniref:ABC transporter F family member 4-like n=1 Tax=Solea solea TaxID=90069 RepID=UPI00272B791B|nr:ABC transporter F family member 4-like [Solea solea]
MATARTSLNCTQSNGIAEVSSAKSPHVVSENVTMEYISQYRESSGRPSKQDEVSDNKSPADAGIDSGDDLFITQKPVPEPVRSRRQRSCNLRSPRDGEEDESDSSSSSSRTYKKRSKIKRVTLPKYSFPFLPQRKRSKNPQFTRQLTTRQNITLHTFSMGGFFQCARELGQDNDKGDDVPSSLPTVDTDGEYISPLSEEEERSESVDIKVVERKIFVAASKAKGIPQKSNRSVKGQRGKSNNDRRGMSLGRQRKTGQKIQAEESTLKDKAMFSDTESSDDGGPSRGAQAEKRTSHTSIQAQTEPPHTERRLTRANKRLAERQEREEELCHSSDATVGELPELQRSPRYRTLNGSEVSLNVTEPQAGVSHTDLSQTGQAEEEPESQSLLLRSLPRDIANDIMYSEMGGEEKNKSKRDHEHVEETCSQSPEEPECLPTARPVDMSEENPLPTQISDEMEINDENGREKLASLSDDDAVRRTPDTKQEKRKRKKTKRTADHLGQEEDGIVESDVRVEKDSLSLLTSNEANGGKKKKKKEKRQYSKDDNSVEPQQPGTVLEPLNDDADTPRKKKKKKKDKEKEIVIVDEGEEDAQLSVMELENIESSQERLASTCETKRKKHKKKRQTPPDDVIVEPENGEALSHDATLEESPAQSVKKKKKKKRENLSEDEAISCTPDQKEKLDDADTTLTITEGPDIEYTELVTKKKKKKKKSEKSCRNVTEDTVTQSDGSVSARKKKKRRASSFLDADAEEKDAQTHGEQRIS